jgi:hypothetical protein
MAKKVVASPRITAQALRPGLEASPIKGTVKAPMMGTSIVASNENSHPIKTPNADKLLNGMSYFTINVPACQAAN